MLSNVPLLQQQQKQQQQKVKALATGRAVTLKRFAVVLKIKTVKRAITVKT